MCNLPMLVMFDIDGTLTETMQIDEECYIQTFLDVFGFTNIDPDWSSYPHATDSGIFQHIYTLRRGVEPASAEVSRFRQHFAGLLTAASARAPFGPITGAGRILTQLQTSGTYRVSLATGGWSITARLKMASAGMSYDEFPSASADDGLERETIMQISKQRAADRYGESFASVVYVGDGVWDARACRTLGIPFIGIGSGVRAERLAAEGAVRVFEEFSHPDLFLDTLNDLQNGP